MPALRVHGGVPLRGVTDVQGSKNVALHLLAAAILNHDVTTVENVPCLPDMDVVVGLLADVGIVAKRGSGRVTVDGRSVTHAPCMSAAAGTIRPTLCFAAALLARAGACDARLPGGDRFCTRGIDVHLRAFRAAGASIEQAADRLHLRAPSSGLRPFTLDALTPYGPSLGGTVTALLLAAAIPETSVIWSPSPEPEVTETVAMLRSLGVRTISTNRVMRVTGQATLSAPVRVHNPADRMVAGTLVLYAAITGGMVSLPWSVADVLPAGFVRVASGLGILRCITPDHLRYQASGPLRPVEACTAVHPGFPTDLQPQLCAAAGLATGISRITETVYAQRETHVAELARFGIAIRAANGPPTTLSVHGPESQFGPAEATASDIRAGAALLGAALAAPGESLIVGAEHLARGYENLPKLLTNLGGTVTWADDRTTGSA